MPIKVENPYENIRPQLGISFNKIRQTIREPDDVTKIDLNKVQKELMGYTAGEKLDVGFYLKRYTSQEKAYYLLVCTREPKPNRINVTSAFKITNQLVPDVDEIAPIQIIQRLVEKFGENVRIGDQTRKFFYREMIPIRPRTRLIGIPPTPMGHEIVVSQYVLINSKSNNILCALVYAINYTRYKEWLKSVEL